MPDSQLKYPEISVIMSVHNAEKYVAEAVQSVLNQDYRNFEFIIIDDGSTDNTKKILQSFSDKRIIYVENESNVGLTKSLNIGLKMAIGKYIARMDADDICVPERLTKQVKLLEDNPEIGLCGGWVETFDEDGNISVRKQVTSPEEIKCQLFFNNCIWHPTVLFRKELFLANNLFYNEDFLYAQDYELWIRASFICKLYNLPEILVRYRLHKNQIESSKAEEQDKFVKNSYKSVFDHLKFNSSHEELDLHLSLFKLQYFKWDIGYLKNAINWLRKIKTFNKNNKKYDKKIFEKILSHQYFKICNQFISHNNGTISVWFNYYFSTLSKPLHISFKKHSNLFFNSVPSLKKFKRVLYNKLKNTK